MIDLSHSPTFLTLTLIIFLIFGLLNIFTGRQIHGRGVWLVWAGFAAILSGLFVDTQYFLDRKLHIKIWKAGWIWPTDQLSAMTVGVQQDVLGCLAITLTIVIGAIFLTNRGYLKSESHPERIYSGLMLSIVGVILNWVSLTPSLSLVGILLNIIGGILGAGSRWGLRSESKITLQFAVERFSGLIFCCIGVFVLLTTQAGTSSAVEAWSFSGREIFSAEFGLGFIVLGLFMQLQPFPFLSGLITETQIHPFIQIVLQQILPALAAVGFMIHLQSGLIEYGLLVPFGWLALVSTLLVLLAGVFQLQWRKIVLFWTAAGYSLVFVLLAFIGPAAAFALLIGVSFASLGFVGSAAALEVDKKSLGTKSKKKSYFLRFILFVSAASGTGLVGFVSAFSGFGWLMGMMEAGTSALIVCALIWFMFVLLGWKLVWSVMRNISHVVQISWIGIFSLLFGVIFSLGIFYTGSVSGGVVFQNTDQFIFSLLIECFGPLQHTFDSLSDFTHISIMYWGIMLTALSLAYWMSSQSLDRWLIFSQKLPRVSQFFSSGYGLDRGLARGLLSAIHHSSALVDYLEEKGSTVGSQAVVRIVKKVTHGISMIDARVSLAIRVSLMKGIDIPARVLQVTQVDDVRWYLVIALSSGFGLLFYLWKV